MLKTLFLSLVFLTILSLTVPSVAEAALPCKASVLQSCYASCRELFQDEVLRTACYGGCLIGCYTSGAE